ncbi:MAG: hypothetical protein FWD69_09390 [Polyangiaceae bacterium]|nr:hypothetical protein [Polyangiaceae bacterium]
MEGDLAEIATMLDCEPPVLKWAASLARTLDWGPLRTRLLRGSSLAKAPWHEDVAKVVAAQSPEERTLLATLAACDAPFAWDVLEAVIPDVSIDGICRLEDARLLRRSESAGVVAFVVPYAMRAHLQEERSAAAERWLDAWVARAEVLHRAGYGPSARVTLAELRIAVPLAARALFSDATAERGLSLWIATSDATFFGDAIAFDAPAFSRAVAVADAADVIEPRVHARLVASRALLERGDPKDAGSFSRTARRTISRDMARSGASFGRSHGCTKIARAQRRARST